MHGFVKTFLSASQIRAARALIAWSQDDLAKICELSVATIRKLELGHISPCVAITQVIRQAFEDSGLEFIEPDGVRRRPEDIRVYQGSEGARDFFDDVYNTARHKRYEVVLVCPSASEYLSCVLGDYIETPMSRMTALKEGKKFVKCILIEDTSPLWASAYCEYRQISKNYVNSVPFYVYGDKYAIIVPEGAFSPKITVLQSHAIAEAFRMQFYSMCDKAALLN